MKYTVCLLGESTLGHDGRCKCTDKKEAAPLQRERPQAKHDVYILSGYGSFVKQAEKKITIRKAPTASMLMYDLKTKVSDIHVKRVDETAE